MRPILYFAHWCPDTEPFIAELKRFKIDYEAVDITQNGGNLKAFLRLRDRLSAFDEAKQNGYIGIPALLLDKDTVVLDATKLDDIFAQ
ncbi:glutaredoxin-related protein [Volucribacter psittacicida]|uniref:Glutaredoxin-related protein n=1 Tax=Volucribacter psittacicida TaxID=203482 RepID=A0A4R1FXS8_9PAST|nr:hypothetical protein [Volucribacter psittacicida]TCJ98539.1 glutaredoxin-related protein [Volucribacter psittacicida]